MRARPTGGASTSWPTRRPFVTGSSDEFPRSMRELLDGGIDRRRFLQLMAASIGLAGLNGCRRPEIQALPYTKPPEEVVPGLPNYYATAMPRPGSASPVLVESHEGRPTKIEGNPKHPDSAGATDAIAQASVLDLYDPDRFSPVLQGGAVSTWQAYDTFAGDHFAALRRRKGQGLHVLSEDVASPSLDLLREHLRAVMPEARWHTYQAISPANARAGATLAFGSPVVPRCQIDRAKVVLALDCDFLGLEEEGGRHLLGFAQARRVGAPSDSMNRLYVVESRFSLTGGMADHRLRLPASHVRDYTLALARAVLAGSSADQSLRQALQATTLGKEGPATNAGPWIEEVAADLKAHAGRAVILAGRRQPPLVHALVHAMNAALGNLGKTVDLRNAPNPVAGTLAELAEAAGKGQVETLVILGGNPAYDAPADLEFAALDEAGQDHDPAGIVRRRDFARGHLAPARRALPRVVGRCPHRRRDGRADPAPDRAARRRADGARGGCPTGRFRDDVALRDRPPRVSGR